jgi:hypothetical protein
MGAHFHSVSNQKVQQPNVLRDHRGFAGSRTRSGGPGRRFVGFEGIENELRRIVAAQRIFQVANSLRGDLRSAEGSGEIVPSKITMREIFRTFCLHQTAPLKNGGATQEQKASCRSILL